MLSGHAHSTFFFPFFYLFIYCLFILVFCSFWQEREKTRTHVRLQKRDLQGRIQRRRFHAACLCIFSSIVIGMIMLRAG